jgi:hypothetical protein
MSAVTEIHTVQMHDVRLICEVHAEDGDFEITEVLLGSANVMPLLSAKVLDCLRAEIFYRVNA